MDRFYFDSMFESSNYGLDLDLDYFNDYNDYFLENEYDKYYDEFNYFLENELDNYSDYNYFLENEYDLSYYTPLNEGVWDNIKNWIKMIIDKIKKAYNYVVEKIKSLFRKSGGWFKSSGPSAADLMKKTTDDMLKIQKEYDEKTREAREKLDDMFDRIKGTEVEKEAIKIQEQLEKRAEEAVKKVETKAKEDISVAPPTAEELEYMLKTYKTTIPLQNRVKRPDLFKILKNIVDDVQRASANISDNADRAHAHKKRIELIIKQNNLLDNTFAFSIREMLSQEALLKELQVMLDKVHADVHGNLKDMEKKVNNENANKLKAGVSEAKDALSKINQLYYNMNGKITMVNNHIRMIRQNMLMNIMKPLKAKIKSKNKK